MQRKLETFIFEHLTSHLVEVFGVIKKTFLPKGQGLSEMKCYKLRESGGLTDRWTDVETQNILMLKAIRGNN